MSGFLSDVSYGLFLILFLQVFFSKCIYCTLTVIDECQEFGVCSQKCKNTINGVYECYCDEGYTLQSDNKSCKATGPEARLFFTSDNELKGVLLPSRVNFTVTKEFVGDFGISHDGHHVFWTTKDHVSIAKSNENGSDVEILVDNGLKRIVDLAIDYVTGNIYFTDRGRNHIAVCTKSGQYCAILHTKDIRYPGYLVLFPQKGIMFWTDKNQDETSFLNQMISMSYMDGSNRKPFLQPFSKVSGLALDIHNDRLYFVNNGESQIETVKLDGSDRRTLFKDHVYLRIHNSAAVFEDFLYFSKYYPHPSSVLTSGIENSNKFTGLDRTTIFEGNYVDELIIYHPALQPKVKNPCESNPCSHICMIAPNSSYTCGCPQHTELSLDKHTCREISETSKPLLFAIGIGNTLIIVQPDVLGMQLQIKHYLSDINNINCMAYDPLTQSLIISVSDGQELYRYYWESRKLEKMNVSGERSIVSMSLDPDSNNLYFCDKNKKSVEVLNLVTQEQNTIYKDGNTPVSIVAVPQHGVLFIAVLLPNDRISIEKVNLNGSLVDTCFSRIRGPTIDFTYDKKSESIIWSNAAGKTMSFGSIECSYSGAYFLNSTPISVAFENGIVAWTSRESSYNYYEAGRLKIKEYKHKRFPVTKTRLGFHNNQNQTMSVVAISEGNISDDIMDCFEDEYRCKDGQCLPINKRCDGVKDCSDESDELDCPHVCNEKNNYGCSIDKSCKENCKDASDKSNCEEICKQGYAGGSEAMLRYSNGYAVLKIAMILLIFLIF